MVFRKFVEVLINPGIYFAVLMKNFIFVFYFDGMLRTNSKIQLYPLVRIAAMLIAGIISGEQLKDLISPSAWLLLTGGGIFFAFVLRQHCIVQGIFIMLSSFFFGGYLIANSEKSLIFPLPENETEYEAVLFSEPVERGKTVQMDIVAIVGDGGIKVKAALLRDTTGHRHENLHIGDGIRVFSLLKRPENSRNSTFDYARWLMTHGYLAQTFIYSENWEKAEVSLQHLSLVERTKLAAMKMRGKLTARFQELGLEGREYATVTAMTLGDKSLIDKELKNDYSISGASHVLALSGLHLGIVYAVLSFLFSGFRKYWLSQLLILTAIWSYVFLVGMTSSVLRSAIMLTIYSFVGLLERDKISVNTLAFAALIMLVANPLNLYDIGFQLSFMAVLAILTTVPFLYTFLPVNLLRKYRFLSWICGMLVVSFAAQLGTAPLVAYHFGRIPVYFLLTNIVAVPCATFILYAAVFFFLSMGFPAVQIYIVKTISLVAGAMNETLGWIAGLPGASVEGVRISEIQVLMLYIMICSTWVIVSYFRRDRYRYGL